MKRSLRVWVEEAFAAPGSRRVIRRLIQAWIREKSLTGEALDVGCGIASRLEGSGLFVIGVDTSLDCVEALLAKSQNAMVADATALPFSADMFGSVWSFGLLHHLADPVARNAAAEMARVTAPGGWTIVFDAVLPRSSWRRPVAALVRRLDRGRFMRSEPELRALLDSATRGKGRWECRRLTYAWNGLEGLFCVRQNPPE